MKKQTKGIIFSIIFGGGLLFWATAASMPNVGPGPDSADIAGTPAANYPVAQRPQFCGTGPPESTRYIQEYEIPTPCTQPLAIATDSEGKVWFAQTNTGKVAQFDPDTESFTEYENSRWLSKENSMMWDMEYSPDGYLWYTEEKSDSIWRFSTQDGKYSRYEYATTGDSYPQRIELSDSQIIINDLTGGKLSFAEAASAGGDNLDYVHFQSPREGSLTGDFAVDDSGYIWYTNWIYQEDGVLVLFDHDEFQREYFTRQEGPLQPGQFVTLFPLPRDAAVLNGLTIGQDGKVWLMETASNYFFNFDPVTRGFTKYTTSIPAVESYGNATGVIKNPISRPYWAETDEAGRIVFNEQTGNRLAVFDPEQQSLVEYEIPSRNPEWTDCEGLTDCGLAQAFGFTIHDEKIWFTEWVENKIGVLDTSVPLPFTVQVEPAEIVVSPGDTATVSVTIAPNAGETGVFPVTMAETSKSEDIKVRASAEEVVLSFDPATIEVYVTAGELSRGASHKVLVGATTGEVTISQYVTVKVR